MAFPTPNYPAVKIARSAVSADLRRSGIGRKLTRLALGLVKSEISTRVGWRFIVLDAKQTSVQLYLSEGFTFLDTTENRARNHPIMFLDLNKAWRAASPTTSEAFCAATSR
jgi:predicted GNAT family N-acyltransferase